LKHWKKRIKKAEKRKVFTGKDVTDSRQWTTCATGDVPFSHRGDYLHTCPNSEPRDFKLASWGIRFYKVVEDDNVKKAKKLFKKISKRIRKLY
jgi:hypothetical protein